jgi:ubiquinone/menaquinone biosynthesis C-methylase UbiE
MNSLIQQNKIAYNYLAEIYTKKWADKPDIQLADAFIDFLSPSARILDIGCGPGQYSLYFYKHGFDVKGVDFSENMISIAKKLCDKVEFEVQDMRDLSFNDNVFDALWVCSSFVHIPTEEAIQVLKEFKRILKYGGILFINAIIGNLPYRLETEQEIGGAFKGNGRYFQWYPTSSSFIEILNTVNFIVEKTYTKSISSLVVGNATVKTNEWFNCICRKT